VALPLRRNHTIEKDKIDERMMTHLEQMELRDAAD
jgi:hypothetical protein